MYSVSCNVVKIRFIISCDLRAGGWKKKQDEEEMPENEYKLVFLYSESKYDRLSERIFQIT